MSATLTRTLQYLPVGVASPQVSATSAIVVDDTAQEVSDLDIPAGYDPGLDPPIDIPFGNVNVAAKGVMLYNANTQAGQDMIMTIGAAADLFRIPPGGVMKFALPTDPTTGRVTAMSFKLPAVQVAVGHVHAYVFGE